MVEIQEIVVNYTPATIEVVDRESFEQSIHEVVEKYKSYIVTDETLADDKKVRAALNKLKTELNNKRIAIKNEFNLPYDEFKTWIDRAMKPLTDTIELIDKDIKAHDEEIRQLRLGVIEAKLEELLQETELDKRIFDNQLDGWAKAANFNNQFELKKSFISDSLQYAIDVEIEKLERFKKDSSAISSLAFENNFGDEPYIRQLREGKELSEVIDTLRADAEKQKAREEAEAQRKAEKEARLQELANQQLEKEFHAAETPSEPKTEKVETEKKVLYRATIEIDFDSLSEKDRWKQVMITEGFGQFRHLKFEKVEAE